jgi:hypothetical protein
VTALSSRTLQVSAAGWSSLVARRAHNPKVTGSNPVPATKCLRPVSLLAGLKLFCSASRTLKERNEGFRFSALVRATVRLPARDR